VTKAKQPKPAKLDVLVANGVNLDLLGTREPEIYGTATLADVEAGLRAALPGIRAATGAPDVALTFFQSNEEPALFAKLDEGWSGALVNPGAWTHTSLALADRLKGLSLPYVEVHISNVSGREEFRRHSFTAPGARGVVHGFGIDSYLVALYGLMLKLRA
jgi:3-dehydroquinate dehydratase-2